MSDFVNFEWNHSDTKLDALVEIAHQLKRNADKKEEECKILERIADKLDRSKI